MKKRTPISKIMSNDIITINKTQSIREVSEIIRDKNIRHVPVVSGEKIIGMLSKVDLQKISFVNTVDGDELTTALYDGLNIEQVMTKDVKVVQKNDTIYDVATILSKNEFHSLPVLENEKLVGIVTTTDLIKYLVDQYWTFYFRKGSIYLISRCFNNTVVLGVFVSNFRCISPSKSLTSSTVPNCLRLFFNSNSTWLPTNSFQSRFPYLFF